MKMTPAMLIIGSLMVFWASTATMVIVPAILWQETPSEIWRPMTAEETAGHELYVSNGCSYCHSQYIRIMDWGHGAMRIAHKGDYVGRRPAILGTERWGPDLSQEGGIRSNDWHVAHFINPRTTRPVSVMPSWEFLGPEQIDLLTAYMQFEGMQAADYRMQRQRFWKEYFVEAFEAGPDENIRRIHAQVPPPWRPMPNPYPSSEDALLRGKVIYQEFCIGCHGPIGDGQGRAAPWLYPPPLNFTTLRRHLWEGKYIGGIFYYQIMNGITGTAMPFFKQALESEKIWDVSNYVAVTFVGYTDADMPPEGIDASYESLWQEPYRPPIPDVLPRPEPYSIPEPGPGTPDIEPPTPQPNEPVLNSHGPQESPP